MRRSWYELTEEGKKYVEVGLPEKRLVKWLESKGGSAGLKEARSLEDFTIGLKWAKEKGYVKIEEDRLLLLKNWEEDEHFYDQQVNAGNWNRSLCTACADSNWF